MFGVQTRYCRCEATRVALRVADWLRQTQLSEVTIRPEAPRPARLSPRWDRSVARAAKQPFTEWAGRCGGILWTHVPAASQLEWARARGIKTVLLLSWEDCRQPMKTRARAADYVLCTAKSQAQRLSRRWGVFARHLPWDAGQPLVTRQPAQASVCRITLPLFDRLASQMEATAIDLAGRLLYRFEHAVLSVSYNPSTLTSLARRRLKSFRKYFGARLQEERKGPFESRYAVFLETDLTLLPLNTVQYASAVLASLSLGAPVACFAIPPLGEFLNANNAILTPSGGYLDADGIARPQPDYRRFEAAINTVLSCRSYLERLQSGALFGLASRRRMFDDTLRRVLL